MFHAPARPRARILRSAQASGSLERGAPSAAGWLSRVLYGLDILSLAVQLSQLLPPLWFAALLVGIGTWLDSLIVVTLMTAPAIWWLLRWRPSHRRPQPTTHMHVDTAEPDRPAKPYSPATPHLPRMRRSDPDAQPYRKPHDNMALDRLQEDVVALVRSSLRRDPVQLQPDIENTARRIQMLLDEGQYPRHLDRLRLLASISHCVATDNDLNLGNRHGATTNVRWARMYAESIGHLSLQAWCCSVQSWIRAIEGLPHRAAILAASGQQFATTSVARRRLYGMQGNALALMGDKRGAQRAFDLAQDGSGMESGTEESDDIVDRIGGVFSAPLAKQCQNAAYGLTRLGLFVKAGAHAEKAIQLYAHGPEDQRDYVLESGARVSLAMSHVMRRQLDAASGALRPTFDLPPNRRADYIRMLMADLQLALSKPRFSRSREASNLKAEIEEFTIDRPGRSGGR